MDAIIDIYNIINGQGVAALALFVAVCSAVFAVYSIKKHNSVLLKCNKLSEELLIANRGAIGMGQKIIALEKQLQRGSINHSPVELPSNTAAIALGQLAEITATQNHKAATNIEDSSATHLADKVIAQNTVSEKPRNEDRDTNDNLDLARDLLAKGKALTEVANTCQLSFAEVSLLRALNPTSPSSKHTH